MATIVKGYVVYEKDYGLLDEGRTHDEELLMIVPTEDAAIGKINEYCKHYCCFDPMRYNREVIQDGHGVCWTSTNPKLDGYSYKVWYDPCEFVLM